MNPRGLAPYELSRPAHSARLCDLSVHRSNYTEFSDGRQVFDREQKLRLRNEVVLDASNHAADGVIGRHHRDLDIHFGGGGGRDWP